MAVLLMQSNNLYIGLSSDSKPTNILAGTKFFESDTKDLYLYTGSAWILNDDSLLANNFVQSKKEITTSSTQILAANSDRTFIFLTNNNEYDVWIKFGADAVVGEGIKIGAYDGYLILDRKSMYKGVINGIADGGNNYIAYVEGDL